MRAGLAWVATSATLLLAGCSGPSAPSATVPGPADAAASGAPPAPPIAVPEAVRSFTSARDYRTPAEPVAVTIPAIAVSTDLQQLRRTPDGSIEVPEWHHAGWWAEGPKPGQPGPAVILGHIDSKSGPDVFHRLDQLRPGDEVVVTDADGSDIRFRVQRLERHPKESFPSEAVYGPSLQPGLRLITCGGTFDRSAGHYRDNVIAFAQLA